MARMHKVRRSSNRWRLTPPESYACFCERVRCLQALFDASVTGGGRTFKRNAAVGGMALSKHQIEFGCMAVDMAVDDGALSDLVELHNAAERIGMWAEVNAAKQIVHIQGVAPGE